MTSRRIEDLESRLAEAQQSLSVALARIEAYRCRERLLLRDYEAVRLRARQAGLDVSPPGPPPAQPQPQPQQQQPQRPQQSQSQPQLQENGAVAPLQQAAARRASNGAAQPQHLALTALDESHPLWLHLDGSKVPGMLLIAGDDLHFVQTHARVSAADYLGIRALKAGDVGRLQSGADGGSGGASGGSDSDAEAVVAGGPGGRGGGVLSGAATWLAQKVRTSGSGAGDAAETPTGIGFTNIMTTIMHSLEEDGSSDDAAETDAAVDATAGTAQAGTAAAPPGWDAPAFAAAGPGGGRGPTPYCGPQDPPELQAWDIAWADEFGHMRRLAFEAGLPARAFIAKQTQHWAAAASVRGAAQPTLSEAAFAGAQDVRVCNGCQAPVRLQRVSAQPSADGRSFTARVFSALDLEMAAPDHMRPTELPPEMNEQSGILSGEQARALAGALPARFRLCGWHLLYSTARHGISLQTLYRRSLAAPTLLVVRDSAGHVFGCFTAEGWRVATRYYGSGETFVFQLQPHRVAWRWQRSATDERNDYFQFATPESLAVGGGGSFAIFLADDLLRGSSGISSTFGNPCLAGSLEFTVGQIEVWAITRT